MVGVRRELRAGRRRRTAGSCRAASTVGTSAVPRATIASTRSVGQAGAVLDAVDAGLDQARAARASPKQWAVTRAPCSWAAAIAAANASAGNDGARSPVVARDPVADELDPAVAALRLLGDVRRRGRPARPRGRSCGCSAGCGRCAGRPGSAAAGRRGRGSSGCRPASRSRAAAARRRRGRRSPAPRSSSSSTAPCVVEADVAVRVDQPGHDPALGRPCSAPALRLVGDPPVDDVQVARLAVGQHRSAEPQSVCHARDVTGPRGRTARPGHDGYFEVLVQPGRDWRSFGRSSAAAAFS